MKMNKKLLLLVALLVGTSPANATLIGDSVNITRATNITTFYNQTKVVSSAVEVTDDVSSFQLDITGDSLVFTSLTSGWYFSDLAPPADFYDWSFTDLNFSDGSIITGLDLSGFGYDNTRVSYTADSVVIDINNWSQPPWNQGDTWTIGFLTSSVPEPSILALMALGLFGIGLTRRKNIG